MDLYNSPSKTCAICQNRLEPDQGQAIFIAECLHSFHFSCITSSPEHGNRACPTCSRNWMEIPFQSRTPRLPEMSRENLASWNKNAPWMSVLDQQASPEPAGNHLQAPEPAIYNDDNIAFTESASENDSDNGRIKIRATPEAPAIPKSYSRDNFSILLHLKPAFRNSRVPLDLVCVLDVSASMAGAKLELLKLAMEFVIKSLGSYDRLSVIAFSSTARRLFPLFRVNDNIKSLALQTIKYLSSNGGTNISEGLRMGEKVILDRMFRNPRISIILLSDGQETYSSGTSLQFPVYTFGIGADHDAVSMHSISQALGGTFTYLEGEDMFPHAFTQCMGGLLSVVAQEVMVNVECLHPTLELTSIETLSYTSEIAGDLRTGFVNCKDFNSSEERYFLVNMSIPQATTHQMPLLNVNCTYRNPLTDTQVELNQVQVWIDRPDVMPVPLMFFTEVTVGRSMLRTMNSLLKASSFSERGDLAAAIYVLKRCLEMLSQSELVRRGNPILCHLVVKVSESKDRLVKLMAYKASRRSYVMSGVVSHTQTATTPDVATRWQTRALGNPAYFDVDVVPPPSFIIPPDPR